MEDKSILEELCDMVFENAQPQTESYKQKRSNAAEAGERLHKTLTDEQKQLLEERRRRIRQVRFGRTAFNVQAHP